MAFEEGKDQLTCPACAAIHDVKWRRMPVRERATLQCKASSEVLFQGNIAPDYHHLKLVDPA